MDAHSESRQRVLATASVNPAAAKYILAATKTKFAVARILRIKGSAEQPESTHYSENPSRCNETALS